MEIDREKVIGVLNEIVEQELAGAVRYSQYALMIFGHSRIPIISWMRSQANEGLLHAAQAGEEVTSLGGKVSLGIGELVGTHHDSVDGIMDELIEHEESSVRLYRRLLDLVADRSVSLEEFARQTLREEQLHVAEIRKMLGRTA